jgi:serine/threonine-protein kinase HipA
MNRKAQVYMHNNYAGILTETDTGYQFTYNEQYLQNTKAFAISKTLPKKNTTYKSNVLFPFFDGLIPEGWLLNLAEQNWKLNSHDRFGLLLACCKNCIGAVSIIPANNEKL